MTRTTEEQTLFWSKHFWRKFSSNTAVFWVLESWPKFLFLCCRKLQETKIQNIHKIQFLFSSFLAMMKVLPLSLTSCIKLTIQPNAEFSLVSSWKKTKLQIKKKIKKKKIIKLSSNPQVKETTSFLASSGE